MPNLENQFAILRIVKLHTPQEISKVGNHNDRRGKLPGNVDPKKVELNRSFTPNDSPLLDRVNAKLAGKKFRKDAVKAVEIFCGFSPGCEKFVSIEQWAQASLDYVKRKFGEDNLVSAVLHMDEQTPHMHFVIIPMVGDKLAAKRIFGTRKQLHEMQNEFHAVVKKFGLQRGTKGSSRPHLTMRQIYEGTHEGMEIVQKTLDSIPKKSPVEGWKGYSEKLRDHLSTALEPLTTAKTAATLAALEIQSLRKLVNDSEVASKAHKDRLRQLDLREVATRLLGYDGVKDGKSTVFEDDARKIVITGNAFKDENSDARGERGAISLTCHILDVDFDTAVRILAQHFPEAVDVVKAEAVRAVEASIKTSVESAINEQIDTGAKIEHFAQLDKGKLKVLEEHLENIKGIPAAIIKSLINHTKLWANRWGSACFVRVTADELRMGVTIVGTKTEALQSIGPKDAFFTVGDLTKLKSVAIAPNPIDAMKIHAASGQPVIAVESIDLAADAFEFLRQHGITSVKLPDEEAGVGERMKAQWKSEADVARFMIVEDAQGDPKKPRKNISPPKPTRPKI